RAHQHSLLVAPTRLLPCRAWSGRSGNVRQEPSRQVLLAACLIMELIATKPDITVRDLMAEFAERGIWASHAAACTAKDQSFKKEPARQRAGLTGCSSTRMAWGLPRGTVQLGALVLAVLPT